MHVSKKQVDGRPCILYPSAREGWIATAQVLEERKAQRK